MYRRKTVKSLSGGDDSAAVAGVRFFAWFFSWFLNCVVMVLLFFGFVFGFY